MSKQVILNDLGLVKIMKADDSMQLVVVVDGLEESKGKCAVQVAVVVQDSFIRKKMNS